MSLTSTEYFVSTIVVALTLTANIVMAETPDVHYRTVEVDKLSIFYREAGSPNAPTVLLLHGFPTSSQMFRNPCQQISARNPICASCSNAASRWLL